MVQLRLISGKAVSGRRLKQLIFRQQLLAMAERVKWAAQNMGASVRGFVRNTLIYRALCVTFWMGAFLLPWLLLVSAFILKVFVDLIGKARKCANSNVDFR